MDNAQIITNDQVNIAGISLGIKQFQNIYNSITGKTEALSDIFKDNHLINYGDIENLYSKIIQILDVKDVVAKSLNIVIYHCNDKKESFTSYERFSLYNTSTVSPVENIYLNVDFVLRIPETSNVENYSIKINLHSRIGQSSKDRKSGNYIPGFMSLFRNRTGNYRIEYVNYVIAREIDAGIKEWYDGLEKSKSNSLMKFLREKSDWIPPSFQIFSIIFMAFSIYFIWSSPFNKYSENVPLFMCILIGFILVAQILSHKIGEATEMAIDSTFSLSYVKLNKGDEKAISAYKKQNSKGWKKALWETVFAVIINCIAAFAAGLITTLT